MLWQTPKNYMHSASVLYSAKKPILTGSIVNNCNFTTTRLIRFDPIDASRRRLET